MGKDGSGGRAATAGGSPGNILASCQGVTDRLWRLVTGGTELRLRLVGLLDLAPEFWALLVDW